MNGLEADAAFVREFCRWAQLTPSALAKRIGVAATTLLRPYNGTATTRLSQPTLDKMRARFPDYPGWTRELPDHLGMLGFRPDPEERPGELVYIRSVEISLAMGEGALVDDFPSTGLVPFNLDFVRSVTSAPIDKLVIMTGHGESMEPTLLRSDLLMFDTSDRGLRISDAIWAFHYAGGGMVKRLRRVRESGRDRLLILSDNPAVPPQCADIEDIHVLGRLVWVGRRM